jgi:hypothetical protein
MKLIKHIAKVVFLVVMMLTFGGCKDKDSSPKMANALLYGSFSDKGTADNKLFAMRLHADGAFTWYDARNTFSGNWTQEKSKVEFKFTSGAGNTWGGTIQGDKLTNLIGPTPDGFYFNWISVAESGIPKKLKDTNWGEINQSNVLFIVPGEPDAKFHIVHGHYSNLGSEGIIYDQVDRQVLIPSKTLNFNNYSAMILLNGDNLILHRYDPTPRSGEQKYGTYTYIVK